MRGSGKTFGHCKGPRSKASLPGVFAVFSDGRRNCSVRIIIIVDANMIARQSCRIASSGDHLSNTNTQAQAPLETNGLGTRMRAQRHRLSMTLQQLSAASGVSLGYLSQVERGNATPTLGTLNQIASALEVEADYFVRTPRAVDSLTRGVARPKFAVAGSSIEYEQIGAERTGHELTSYVMNVPPGYASEVVTHVGEEIIYILEGEISQMVGEREYLMTAGDSLHYLGTTPHCWSNKTQKQARILWVGRMEYDKSGEIGQAEVKRSDNVREMLPLRR